MRQLRPGLTCYFGKTQFFFLRKRNQIRVSLYVSHTTRWVSRSLNPTGVVKTMIVRHWVRASGTLRATSRHFNWKLIQPLDLTESIPLFSRNVLPASPNHYSSSSANQLSMVICLKIGSKRMWHRFSKKESILICWTTTLLALRVIPREIAQENPRPPSILMKIDKPIVPHDRNMYAQF